MTGSRCSCIYFTSTRPGGFGLTDLYVSRRRDKLDNLAWAPPVNLGSAVNSSSNDRMSADPFEDERNENEILYFVSDRAGGLGGDDIYVSTLDPNGTWGPVRW